MQREELAFEIAVLGEEFEGFDGEGVLLRVKGEEKAVRFAIFRDELEEGVEFGFRVGDDIGESNSVVEGDALRFSSRREGISAEERTGEGEGALGCSSEGNQALRRFRLKLRLKFIERLQV